MYGLKLRPPPEEIAQHFLHLGAGTGVLALPDAEFKLLEALSHEPGAVLSREVLNAAMQPGAYRPQGRTVDSQIYRLRGKLQAADPQGQWISTVRGQGYALLSGQPSEPI